MGYMPRRSLEELSHGTYQIKVVNKVLEVRGAGPWNVESAKCFVRDMDECLLESRGDVVGLLAVLEGESFSPQDAQDVLKAAIESRAEKKFLFPTAVVFKSLLGRSLYTSLFASLYENTAIPFEVFRCEEDALSWLKAMSFQAMILQRKEP